MKKLGIFFGLVFSFFTLTAATPPLNTYPKDIEAKDIARFETIVVGNNYLAHNFTILEKHKSINFVWNGIGKKVFATASDQFLDGKPDGGCLAICEFKDSRWIVTTVFFPSMYRSDGRIRQHSSYYIPENLVWYENGTFHFAPCSMIIVNYKRGIGMLEVENKIAALNVFLNPHYWPYLSFPHEIDPAQYEEAPGMGPRTRETDPVEIKREKPTLVKTQDSADSQKKLPAETLPEWFFHAPVP